MHGGKKTLARTLKLGGGSKLLGGVSHEIHSISADS